MFPDGPNVAVIGTDGNAETIKYESINGNILVGCVRGFQGKASVWDKDTIIARNFTEYDLDAIQENILELDNGRKNYLTEDEVNGKIENTVNGAIESISANISADLKKKIDKSAITDEYDKHDSQDKVVSQKGVNDLYLIMSEQYSNLINGVNEQLMSKANRTDIPTKLSQLTNDENFKTEAEIQTLINNSTKLKKEIVTSLPSTGKDDVIYLVKDAKGKDNNNYLEYLWLNGKYELIGSTQVDLSDYAKKSTVTQIQSELGMVELKLEDTLDKEKDKAKLVQNMDWQDDKTYTTPYFVSQAVGTLTTSMLQGVDDYLEEEMPKKLDKTTDKAIAPQDSNPNSSVWQDDNKYVTPKFLSTYVDLEISGRDETIQTLLGSKLDATDIQEFTQQELEEAFKW